MVERVVIGDAELWHGDAAEVLPLISQAHAVVTDPPYGLSFMNRHWDYDVPEIGLWRLVLAAMLPGAHLLSFAGTRTQHRMAVNIEDAGFEIRDMIAWVYGSGFPKSLDVSKAIDKAAGAERDVIGKMQSVPNHNLPGTGARFRNISELNGERIEVPIQTAPATKLARQWAGWGTALKPAMEPITVARKPITGTVAANVLVHGAGAINVDGCRVGTETINYQSRLHRSHRKPGLGGKTNDGRDSENYESWADAQDGNHQTIVQGRWPANLIHDGSDEVVGLFPQTTSHGGGKATYGGAFGNGKEVSDKTAMQRFAGDHGSAARFFYCAKASKADRDDGCEGLEEKCKGAGTRNVTGNPLVDRIHGVGSDNARRNHHPTVKPTDLMRYLCRLVTPPGGIVLDQFMGSGSTGKAAVLEGFRFIGIERDREYFEIAIRRIEAVQRQGRLHIADEPRQLQDALL